MDNQKINETAPFRKRTSHVRSRSYFSIDSLGPQERAKNHSLIRFLADVGLLGYYSRLESNEWGGDSGINCGLLE